MKKIHSIARNLSLDVRDPRDERGAATVRLTPTAEIVLILYETDWSLTVTGDSARSLRTETVRFAADEPSLRRAIASLAAFADELSRLDEIIAGSAAVPADEESSEESG